MPISGIFANIIGGSLLNKYKKFKLFSIVYLIIGMTSIIVFIYGLSTGTVCNTLNFDKKLL